MAMIFDCLPNIGTLVSMKHLLSISIRHLCEVEPRFFSWPTSTSSASNFSVLECSYCFSEKGYTNVTSPIVSVSSTGCLGLLGTVLRPLISSWCATRLELIRHGRVEIVGSLERFEIV